jgi:hypothetical protein
MNDNKKENDLENHTDAVLCSETTTQPGPMHNLGLNCRCGCIPSNMVSLFEMAEMRKKLKQQREKEAMNRKEDPKQS